MKYVLLTIVIFLWAFTGIGDSNPPFTYSEDYKESTLVETSGQEGPILLIFSNGKTEVTEPWVSTPDFELGRAGKMWLEDAKRFQIEARKLGEKPTDVTRTVAVRCPLKALLIAGGCNIRTNPSIHLNGSFPKYKKGVLYWACQFSGGKEQEGLVTTQLSAWAICEK